MTRITGWKKHEHQDNCQLAWEQPEAHHTTPETELVRSISDATWIDQGEQIR